MSQPSFADFSFLSQNIYIRARVDESGYIKQNFPQVAPDELTLELPPAVDASERYMLTLRNLSIVYHVVRGEQTPLGLFYARAFKYVLSLLLSRAKICQLFKAGAVSDLVLETDSCKKSLDELYEAEKSAAHFLRQCAGFVESHPEPTLDLEISFFRKPTLFSVFDRQAGLINILIKRYYKPGYFLQSPPVLEQDRVAGLIYAFFKTCNDQLKDRQQRAEQEKKDEEQALVQRIADGDEDLAPPAEKQRKTKDQVDQEALENERANFFLCFGGSWYIYAELNVSDIVFLRSLVTHPMIRVFPQINEIMPRFCVPVFDLDVNTGKVAGEEKFLLKHALAVATQLRIYFAFAFKAKLQTHLRAIHPQYLHEYCPDNAFPIVSGNQTIDDPLVCFIYASDRFEGGGLQSFHLTFPGLRWDKRESKRLISTAFEDTNLRLEVEKALPGFDQNMLIGGGIWDSAVCTTSAHGLRMAFSAKSSDTEIKILRHRVIKLRHILTTEFSRHAFAGILSGSHPDLVWNGHFLGAPFPRTKYTSSGDWVPRTEHVLEADYFADRRFNAAALYRNTLFEALQHKLIFKEMPEAAAAPSPPPPPRAPSRGRKRATPSDSASEASSSSSSSSGRRCISRSSSTSLLALRGGYVFPILKMAPTDEYVLGEHKTMEQWQELYHDCKNGLFSRNIVNEIVSSAIGVLSECRELRLLPFPNQREIVESYIAEAISGYVNLFFAYIPNISSYCERINKTWGKGFPIVVDHCFFTSRNMQERLGEISLVLWPSNGEAEEDNSLQGRGPRASDPKKKKDQAHHFKLDVFKLWNSCPSRLEFNEIVRLSDPEKRLPYQLDIGVRPYITRTMCAGRSESWRFEIPVTADNTIYYKELVEYFLCGTTSGFVESEDWIKLCLGFFEEKYAGTAEFDPERKEFIAGDFILRYEGEEPPTLENHGAFKITRVFTVHHLIRHLKHFLCSGDEALFNYVVRWYAYVLQNPGVLTGKALIYQGQEGTGKNMFNDAFCAIFGPQAAFSNADSTSLDTWNTSIVGLNVVVFNEALHFSSSQQAALRKLITEKTVVVKKKYQHDRSQTNSTNVIIHSNVDRSLLHNPGRDGRRYVYCSTKKVPACDERIWFTGLFAFLENDGNTEQLLELKNGHKALADYFYRVVLDGFCVANVPENTKGKERALASNLTPFQEWFELLLQIKEPPQSTFNPGDDAKRALERVTNELKEWGAAERRVTVDFHDLFSCFNVYRGRAIHTTSCFYTSPEFKKFLTEDNHFGEMTSGIRRPQFMFHDWETCNRNFRESIGSAPAESASASALGPPKLLPVSADRVFVRSRRPRLLVPKPIDPSIVDVPRRIAVDRSPPSQTRDPETFRFTQDDYDEEDDESMEVVEYPSDAQPSSEEEGEDLEETATQDEMSSQDLDEN